MPHPPGGWPPLCSFCHTSRSVYSPDASSTKQKPQQKIVFALAASCERIHKRVREQERPHRMGPCHLAANLRHLQCHLVHTIDTARHCAVRRHHRVHFPTASSVRWSFLGKPQIRQHGHNPAVFVAYV